MMMIQTLQDVEAPGELVSFTGWGNSLSSFTSFTPSLNMFLCSIELSPCKWGGEHSGYKEVIENKD